MNAYIEDLLAFLNASPCSAQASAAIVTRLEAKGFAQLDESTGWNLIPGGRYYVRRDTTVAPWIVGSEPLDAAGFLLAAAHIDSPALKLKPRSLRTEGGVSRIAVEVYGGPILSTWTDRELGIAGRAAVTRNGKAEVLNVDLKRPVAVIPNAAIHLNREVNNGFVYNKQTHLQAILTTGSQAGDPLLAALAEELQVSPEQIGAAELFLYDFDKAVLGGLDGNLVISGRLDNLGMSHAILSALSEAETPAATCLGILYDHEEIGSGTAQGAASTMLSELLERITLVRQHSREEHFLALRKSFLISADMAHAFHPSYPEKYDPTGSPAMNGGPVVKWNASYKYATTAASSQRFTSLCEAAGVDCQSFVMRSDLLCGSTVGPIISAQLGIPAVDVGNPLWAMHSLRETAGTCDHKAMIRVLKEYFK